MCEAVSPDSPILILPRTASLGYVQCYKNMIEKEMKKNNKEKKSTKPKKSNEEFPLVGNCCSPEFRQYVIEKYDIAEEEDLQLFEYIAISGQADKFDPDRCVVSQKIIQEFYGCRAGVIDKLNSFEDRTGIALNIDSDYRFIEGKATTVKPEFDDETKRLLDEVAFIHSKGGDQEKVNFVTREEWTSYLKRNSREKQIEFIEAYNERDELDGHPAKELIKYLNDGKIRKRLERHIRDSDGATWKRINELENETRKLAAISVYNSVKYNIQYYKAVDNSDRVYFGSPSILQYPKEVREVVLNGCYNLDIKATQLSIVATLWYLTNLRDFFESRKDFWGELCNYMGRGLEAKGELKEMTYRIIFGSTKATIEDNYPELAYRFLKHDLIVELRKNRDLALKKIIKNKKIIDAFGRHRSVDDIKDRRSLLAKARSLLARGVQSYEVAIMLAAFEVIKADTDIGLVAWLHDGIYFDITHNADSTKSKIRKIKKAIVAKAKEFSIKMDVDIKWPGE